MVNFLKEAAHVKPSPRQLRWFETEVYAFVHFGVNTFTDREWGLGNEPESIFNPAKLDCDQWVNAVKSAHLNGLVLTAKHHDGFCLWPSKYTEHSVKNSPCPFDIVKEASEACRRGGIKFGFYLSPWDRNCALYGTDAYNDYFCNQLTELLTEYGEIFYVWFDGACGEGPNGRKQVYDYERYISLIRKYQPNAVIFNDFGPDIRWVGNEAGTGRNAEWAVVPSELCYRCEVQTCPGPLANEGKIDYLYNTASRIGDLDQILYSKGLVFAPSEVDMSIRPGWFWHENEEPHSLERLLKTYITSVGGSCSLNLNIPPTRDGLFDERDVKRLKEFGELLDKEFGSPIPCDIKRAGENGTQMLFEIELKQARAPKYVIIREEIAEGQRISSFQIEPDREDGYMFPIFSGTTVGNKRICPLTDPFAEQNPLTKTFSEPGHKLILRITSARDEVKLKSIEVF